MGGKNSGWRGPRTDRSAGNQYTQDSALWRPPSTPEQRAKWALRRLTHPATKEQRRKKDEAHGRRTAARKAMHREAFVGPPPPSLAERYRRFKATFVGPPKPPPPPPPPPQRSTVRDPRFNGEQVPIPAGLRIPECVRIPIKVDMAALGNHAVQHTPLDAVLTDLARLSSDPMGFVMWAFPWGEKGTPLEDMTGPEEWQRNQLQRIGERLRAGGSEGCVIEEDVSSGHGIGKSAMVSWMILFSISTYEDTRGVVTANTDSQLRTKTWAELAKWYEMFVAKALFKLTATSLYLAGDPVREKKWRVDQAPWSKENTEAFAGMHNLGKRILVVFDEAAAIDDHIYEVTEGALTDAKTQIMWLRYGNPTRTAGRFFKNCTQGKRNTYTRVDSRTVSFSNKEQIQAWIDDYGDDSDFVRVRVKGQFPRAGYANFISPELVMAARRRRLDPVIFRSYPKVLAIDPARFGDDMSVITLRQGLKVHWQVSLSGFDGPDLASRVFEIVRTGGVLSNSNVPVGNITCIVYDAIGNGADLDSSLRRMHGLPTLIPVQWGQPAKDSDKYFNQRSEAWGTMRDALEHCQIPDDDELADQLISLDYGYSNRFQIQLQSKKDLKKNGGRSPDAADSLALSYLPELIDRKIVLAKVKPVARRKVIWTR